MTVIEQRGTSSAHEANASPAQQRQGGGATGAAVFERLESEVRIYCRSFPAVFVAARGHLMIDETGREYVDFVSGAGSLNYGHNHPLIKRRVIEYMERDGVTHSLDMYTDAKREFLERFEELILRPRGLNYRVQDQLLQAGVPRALRGAPAWRPCTCPANG